MPKPKYSYDPECENLARYFLNAGDIAMWQVDDDAPKLAQEIQDAVEAYMRTVDARVSE